MTQVSAFYVFDIKIRDFKLIDDWLKEKDYKKKTVTKIKEKKIRKPKKNEIIWVGKQYR